MGNTSARIIKKSISTLTLGCSHGYGFPDGSSLKTIPLGIDCPSLNDWSQALGSHDTCYGEYFFLHLEVSMLKFPVS